LAVHLERTPRRAVVLALAAALFAVTTALRYLVEVDGGPGDGIILLCVLPIALVAMEYGIRGGLLAALFAFADFAVWDVSTGSDTPLVGYGTRGLAFFVLAVLVGRYAQGALAPYDPARLALLRDLHRALERRELVLYYQPIADAVSHRVSSVEALVRWEHPQRGMIPPNEFVPVIERSGLLWEFTRWTLERALQQSREWRDRRIELPIAVNLSSSVVSDPRLPDEIAVLLAQYDLPPSALEVEITESAIMRRPERSAEVLADLARLGVSLIALDDFGTGRSSLARLHTLPIQRLKIDRLFVQEVAANGNRSVMEAIIALARKLGLSTTAEGVEDDETWRVVAELGCDTAQGFCLSRPVPADEFSAWLGDRPTAVA
jgi:EAL domain-containing protein (putative c-di-GMP-specific phosphodiesterase class I)